MINCTHFIIQCMILESIHFKFRILCFEYLIVGSKWSNQLFAYLTVAWCWLCKINKNLALRTLELQRVLSEPFFKTMLMECVLAVVDLLDGLLLFYERFIYVTGIIQEALLTYSTCFIFSSLFFVKIFAKYYFFRFVS